MRRMSDPDYVYRPHSAKRRKRQSLAALARLGIPRGHRRLYGVDVPDRWYATVQKAAVAFRSPKRGKKRSILLTGRFIRRMLAMLNDVVDTP